MNGTARAAFILLTQGYAAFLSWIALHKAQHAASLKPVIVPDPGPRCWNCNCQIDPALLKFRPFCSTNCEYEYHEAGF